LHTERFSRYILVGVVLFVVAVAAVLVVRGRAARTPSPVAIATRADYRIKEVHLQEEARDGVRWQLDADQAEAYEQLGKTTLRKVKIRIEEQGRTWTVTGDEGEMTQESKDVVLRGNVVLVSSDGLRLETTRLRWDAAGRRAWTDDPVTVFRPGAVVTGQGLEARVGERQTQVKGRLRATFGKAPAEPAAAARVGAQR